MVGREGAGRTEAGMEGAGPAEEVPDGAGVCSRSAAGGVTRCPCAPVVAAAELRRGGSGRVSRSVTRAGSAGSSFPPGAASTARERTRAQ
jgi:hypothetical protein